MHVQHYIILFTFYISMMTSFSSISKAQTLIGNLNVTVQNIDGSFVSGIPVYRYNSARQYIDKRWTAVNGIVVWTGIAVGTYYLEAYHNGNSLPYIGDEFWGSGTKQVTSGGTANIIIKRYEPYTQSIVFKNNSTNEILNSSNPIAPNTTVRIEVTVRNQATVARMVNVEILIDRDKVSMYDFDIAKSPQSIAANGGTYTFIAAFTPITEGLYYCGLKIESYIDTGYKLTDTWAWGLNDGMFKVQIPSGDLNVTVQNINGSFISGASVFRYNSAKQYVDTRWTGSNGIAVWAGIAVGTYYLVVYQNGNSLPYMGDEYWGSGTKQVISGATSNVTIKRYEPYTQSIVFKNNSTNEILNSSNPVPANTTVRVEVTVKNLAIVARMVKVELLIDLDTVSSYDFDLVIGPKNITANGGTYTFDTTFTPTTEGLYYRGMKTESYIETEYKLTDTWAWDSVDGAFKVSPFSVGIDQDDMLQVPKCYALMQNYPNPFNPSTTIKYSVPQQIHVTLQLFDVLGRSIASLVNEEKSPGIYEVKFDGSYLSSGVYFYRLSSTDYTEIKKLLLIR